MDSESLQLQDLVPAEPFVHSSGWPWWAWVLVALGVLLLAVWLRAMFRKGQSSEAPNLQLIHDQALQLAMEKIDLAAQQTAVQAAATTCSEAIRRYLATVASDPSLYETHEEFLARHEALNSFPAELKEEVSNTFNRLAKMKYGKSPAGDPGVIASEGRSLLTQLHENLPA
ncbi:hypothetical protein ACFQY0_03770 [Haloferula chungangensis]|uniref:DUF4129 domain-containing protein n=1 Tax=Haloferula chungangensis TaxID=1048331 RepID=A0ABW2L4Q7_9BACT